MLFRPAFLIAGAGLAVAQSLSSRCSSTLLAVATSPNATCLDLSLLAPLALANTSTTSVIPTINNWLTGMCSQGPCSNGTLQAVVNNITTGCASDLAGLGLATNDTSGLVTTVQVAYPTARQIVCLKDTSANSLCVTELLTEVQSATTTLSINNIVDMVTQIVSVSTNISIPQNILCNNCTKAAYDIVAQDFPNIVSSSAMSAVQSTCGASFTDGQIPSNIKQTAANMTSTSGGASLSVSSLNVGVAMLVAVSSAFAMFA